MNWTERAVAMAAVGGILSGCAGSPVALRKGYDQARVHRVAVFGFQDFPGYPGSGQMVASVFEKSLLNHDFFVVERREIDKLIEEQKLQQTDVIDAKSARAIGEILGVDGILLGTVNTLRGEFVDRTTVPTYETISEPVYRTDYVTRKIGDHTGIVPVQVIDSYRTYQKVSTQVETDYWPAEIGATVRMVDVETGELLWVGSHSEQGMNLQEAADDLATRIVREVRKSEARLARASL
jgi:hypothetical protein